jgi:hypothetical protein
VTVGLGLALWSCGREPSVSTMLPAVRILDVLPTSADDRVVHGVDVTLERDMRRTLALPASKIGLATLDGQRYRVTVLPDVVREWGPVRIVRVAVVRDKKVTLPPQIVDLGADPAPGIAVEPLETPQPQIAFTINPAPRSRMSNVETDAFPVPSGAVLAFDVGVPAAQRPPGTVGARVTVVDGRARRVVWKAALPTTAADWRPVRVPLGSFAGRTVRLRFTTYPGHAAGAGDGALFGEPIVLAPRARPTHLPNIVLLSMDTLRARSVGTYGCERATTPTIDALGASGVVFENAFSTAAFTLPGHLSMLTGLWFRTHRALTPRSPLPPEHRTLAEVLQRAGYATGAFTSGAWIMPSVGFRRGFDVYHEQPSASAASRRAAPRTRRSRAGSNG